MKAVLMSIVLASALAVAIPVVNGVFFDRPSEADNLVDAAQRTQEKAQSLSHSYNEVIPPAPAHNIPADQPPQQDQSSPPWSNSGPTNHPGPLSPANAANAAETEGEAMTEIPEGQHPVADAISLLNRMNQEFGPATTEYATAVNQLKRAWQPRYDRAVEEYERFEERVRHAERMGAEYLEVQQRLTQQITDPETRYQHEEWDALEQITFLDWINQANGVLGEAFAIKQQLDNMNIQITKLELSAAFSAIYEGFMKMPIHITILNQDLQRFEQETERIYATFGPGR